MDCCEEGKTCTTAETTVCVNEEYAEEEAIMVEEVSRKKSTRQIRVVMFLLLVLIIIFVIIDSTSNKYVLKGLSKTNEWVESNPIEGAFVLTMVFCVATLAFVPGALLTIGCGFVYTMAFGLGIGTLVGSVVVFVGASLGSELSFIIGRYILRDCAGKFFERYPLLKAMDSAMEKKGLRIFFLLRLSPLVPYNLLNYLAGLMAISFSDYTISLLGLLPGTILFVFVGASGCCALEMSKGGDISKPSRNAKIASIVVGIFFGVLGVVATSYYARKELKVIAAEQEQLKQESQGVDTESQSQHQDQNTNKQIEATETLSYSILEQTGLKTEVKAKKAVVGTSIEASLECYEVRAS